MLKPIAAVLTTVIGHFFNLKKKKEEEESFNLKSVALVENCHHSLTYCDSFLKHRSRLPIAIVLKVPTLNCHIWSTYCGSLLEAPIQVSYSGSFQNHWEKKLYYRTSVL